MQHQLQIAPSEQRMHQASELFDRGRIDEALTEAMLLIEEARKNGIPVGEAIGNGLSGQCCIALARLSQAFRFLHAAESLAARLPSAQRDAVMPSILATLGNAYRNVGMPEKALAYYKDVLSHLRHESSWPLQINTHLDAARVYLHLKQHDLAAEELLHAEQLAAQHKGSVSPMARSHINMIRCLLLLTGYFLQETPDAPDWEELIRSMRKYSRQLTPAWTRILDIIDGIRGVPQKTVARYLQRIWRLSTMVPDLPSHITSHTLMASCAAKLLNDPERAAGLYGKAMEVIHRFLNGIEETEYRCLFMRQNWVTADQYANLLLRLHRADLALAFEEHLRRSVFPEGVEPGVASHGIPALLDAIKGKARGRL